ncbi:MAG: lipopolysaccharide transport periplasmic protein LptA [Pseudomonas sp.]|jgi:lipopolysaccharide export system protein LptA|nr:lipopolysaccharide transport periplasmic protein LptA [Pseudomonas sp.]MDD2221948.1 lipopolysaccharide transport periplasmic protein LptA [Pseudomonas sp.]MDY0413286.1 lipopolysaccharide transport periplasmic protein LptA [Pseudomonas sp.]NLO53034.1 lipopolysaccharide transport periplasmic protein LptA [Gammaproteobacteria bacterium]
MTFARTTAVLITAGLSLLSGLAQALPSDSQQPINIQADSAEMDDKRGVAIYRGDVIITQGTLKITGDTVTISLNKSGDIDVFTSLGKPAYYEQQPSTDKEIIQAYGLMIQYFANNEKIIILDQAKVIQQGNTFRGEKIVYDTQKQIVTAGRGKQGTITTPSPRINMVIQPKNKESTTESSAP